VSRQERDYNDEGTRGSKERAAIVRQNLPTTTPDSSWTSDKGEGQRGDSVLSVSNYISKQKLCYIGLQSLYRTGSGRSKVGVYVGRCRAV